MVRLFFLGYTFILPVHHFGRTEWSLPGWVGIFVHSQPVWQVLLGTLRCFSGFLGKTLESGLRIHIFILVYGS